MREECPDVARHHLVSVRGSGSDTCYNRCTIEESIMSNGEDSLHFHHHQSLHHQVFVVVACHWMGTYTQTECSHQGHTSCSIIGNKRMIRCQLVILTIVYLKQWNDININIYKT